MYQSTRQTITCRVAVLPSEKFSQKNLPQGVVFSEKSIVDS
jgi:hypothetical protein